MENQSIDHPERRKKRRRKKGRGRKRGEVRQKEEKGESPSHGRRRIEKISIRVTGENLSSIDFDNIIIIKKSRTGLLL